MSRNRIHDGAVLKALRERQLGNRSASLLARMLSDRTKYKVHREHMHAYETGTRRLPDTLIEASSRIFGVPAEIFPEYAARHVTPEMVSHPLVAWAILKVKYGKMTPDAGKRMVRSVERLKGDYHPMVVEMLSAQGVRTVQLPRLPVSVASKN